VTLFPACQKISSFCENWPGNLAPIAVQMLLGMARYVSFLINYAFHEQKTALRIDFLQLYTE